MSEHKDSPKPLRENDPNPLFKMEESGYVVKGLTPIQRQRRADGTPYTSSRPSAVEPKDYDLYIGEDKIDKSVSSHAENDSIDPDAVIKAYMGPGEG